MNYLKEKKSKIIGKSKVVLLKVSKSQMHFFLETPLPKKRMKY